MSLGHTNLSYYKAKKQHTHREIVSGRHQAEQWVGGGDRMRPCSPRVVEGVGALLDRAFLTVQGGRLLSINSFARKFQVKFFGIIWVLTQPLLLNNHPVPSCSLIPHQWPEVDCPKALVTSPSCTSDPGMETLDEMTLPRPATSAPDGEMTQRKLNKM